MMAASSIHKFTVGAIALMMISPPAQAKRSAADETRSSMRRVAKCAAEYDLWERHGRNVFAVVNSAFSAPAAAMAEIRYNLTICMEQKSYDGRRISWLKMPESLFRGHLVTGLYRMAELGKYPESFDENAEEFLQMDELDKFMPLRQFGSCVARLDPVNSRAILSTPVAGKEELRGYAALTPIFAQCVAPGETIQFSKSTIEVAVAEGLLIQLLEARRASAEQSVH